MSLAKKCDACGVLHTMARHKTMSLDVNLDISSEGAAIGWSEVNLCAKCTAAVMKIIKPGLEDFPRK